MRKKIIEHIKTGRTKEALNAALTLSLKRGAKKIYNDLLQLSGRLCRAEQEYLLNLISWDEREKVNAFSTAFIIESAERLKKTPHLYSYGLFRQFDIIESAEQLKKTPTYK